MKLFNFSIYVLLDRLPVVYFSTNIVMCFSDILEITGLHRTAYHLINLLSPFYFRQRLLLREVRIRKSVS